MPDIATLRECCAGEHFEMDLRSHSALLAAPEFQRRLYAAWCAAGFDASPRRAGGITFCCPRCVEPARLELGDELVRCSHCAWTAKGKAGEIVEAARGCRDDSRRHADSFGGSVHDLALTPFPLHYLPPAIFAMAQAITNAEGAPESLAGCCTLGILSAAIGAGIQVRSAANRLTRGNLYITASAESGSGKSETFRHAAAPFIEYGQELFDDWKTNTLPDLEAEKDIVEAEIKKLKHAAGSAKDRDERAGLKYELESKKAALANLETKMRAPVLYTEDVTTERLAVLLSQQNETLASLSADAGAVVNNLLGRYSKLERTDEAIYLKAFSGDPCRIDRQSRLAVELAAPCLAALWLVQPDKVQTLLAERGLTDGGLIPRLLICHTNAEPQFISEDMPVIPAEVRDAYRQTIRLLLETYRLADEPRTIQPSPEALAAMIAHHNHIVERRRSDLRDVTTFAARWNEQAWRISVCLHAGQHGASAHEKPLSVDTAAAAIGLADWFAAQQLGILSSSRLKAQRQVKDEVFALLAESPEGIQASDLYRARIVRDAAAAHELLAQMERSGELTTREEPTRGGGHVVRKFGRGNR